ncbi:hypothetical protein HGRIS_006898 [Hohenbuehelia grisea]|uniref:Uncharacterized protein n=1 Tax=Hohenbuehelia grisea TaxID=104357 RepID=A0ABR3JAE1_9AGAR
MDDSTGIAALGYWISPDALGVQGQQIVRQIPSFSNVTSIPHTYMLHTSPTPQESAGASNLLSESEYRMCPSSSPPEFFIAYFILPPQSVAFASPRYSSVS